MLEVYNHNTEINLCSYIALSVNDSKTFLDLAASFLFNNEILVEGKIGFARLHPEDKNYKKSTGREISKQNSFDSKFKLIKVSKGIDGRAVLMFENVDTGACVLALANNNKRPHLVFS